MSLIEACNQLNDVQRYEVRGLLDDGAEAGSYRFGVKVLGGLDQGAELCAQDPDVLLVDCMGSPDNYTRRKVVLTDAGLDLGRFATLIHPHASVAFDAQIGFGSLIFANVSILSDVVVGSHVTILANCVLNHGVRVADFAILASNVCLSGDVVVGSASYLGCGVNVKGRIKIGAGALAGLGSAVIRDIADGETVVGVPARPIARVK